MPRVHPAGRRTAAGGEVEWSYELRSGAERIGGVTLLVRDAAVPGLCPELPSHELFGVDLGLPWGGDWLAAGRALVGGALAAARNDVPRLFQLRVNAEVHDHPDRRNRLAEACGLTLLQEKQGVWWVDDGTPISVPDRLAYRPIAAVGKERYAAVMGRCQKGTIDRNDRYYWGRCGPDDWGRVLVSSFEEADADMWLLGHDGDEPVGYVAVTAVEDWGSTIAHIGVLPEHRGNGYVDDLLAAGTAAAQRAGIRSMLSDYDVLNEPMAAAFRRAGHRADARPWRAWYWWGPVDDVIAACS